MTEEQIDSLAAIASQVAFAEDEVVLTEGQSSHVFYLIVSGSVAVELRSPHYTICVEALAGGQVFGWSALLDDQDTLFQVRARERTTALRISGSDLKAKCRQDAELGVELLQRTLKVVAGRVKGTEIRFAEMCGIRV